VWRPILAKVATLHEIEAYWCLDDLMDANEALDIKDALEAEQAAKINKK
jgi:hypothetical protein